MAAPAGDPVFPPAVEDRFDAFKARRISPRLRLNWRKPSNSMRLAQYFPTIEKMFLRGNDSMAKEDWVNAFVDLHRCATYIFELRKVHNAWGQPQYRKDTQRMVSVVALRSIERCEICVRQIKREIQMSMQAEAERAAQADAALERARKEEAARQAKLTSEMMREEERRARQAGDSGRASIAAQVAEAAETDVVVERGCGGCGHNGTDGSVPIYDPSIVTAVPAKPVLNVGDVAVYKNKGVTFNGAKVIAVHHDGGSGGGEPYYTVLIESAGNVEKQTTREHLFLEGEDDANTTANTPPPYDSATGSTTSGKGPSSLLSANPSTVTPSAPPAPSIAAAPVMPNGPLYSSVPAPTSIPARNLSTTPQHIPQPKPPAPSTNTSPHIGPWRVNQM